MEENYMQYNVMVTCNAHDFVIGSSNLSTALNYSSKVEQSTHNGCISVQFWVVQWTRTIGMSIPPKENKYKINLIIENMMLVQIKCYVEALHMQVNIN